MKLLEGTVYTKEMSQLVSALEASGLVVREVSYDSRRVVHSGITKGIAYIYNLFNRVKITTLVSDEVVGSLMETLRSFGECKFMILSRSGAESEPAARPAMQLTRS